MKPLSTILILDQDSDLAAILGSFLIILGYGIQYTTRVNQAIKKLSNQKFSHILLDPNLKPDNVERFYDELAISTKMNAKTPFTIMTHDKDFLIPLTAITRINSILVKPFTLEELDFRIKMAKK